MSTEAEQFRARENECEELEMSTASLRMPSERVWLLPPEPGTIVGRKRRIGNRLQIIHRAERRLSKHRGWRLLLHEFDRQVFQTLRIALASLSQLNDFFAISSVAWSFRSTRLSAF